LKEKAGFFTKKGKFIKNKTFSAVMIERLRKVVSEKTLDRLIIGFTVITGLTFILGLTPVRSRVTDTKKGEVVESTYLGEYAHCIEVQFGNHLYSDTLTNMMSMLLVGRQPQKGDMIVVQKKEDETVLGHIIKAVTGKDTEFGYNCLYPCYIVTKDGHRYLYENSNLEVRQILEYQ
jgi:hypothetical protein